MLGLVRSCQGLFRSNQVRSCQDRLGQGQGQIRTGEAKSMSGHVSSCVIRSG